MRLQWLMAAALSSALIAGCGAQNDENAAEPPPAASGTDVALAPAEPAGQPAAASAPAAAPPRTAADAPRTPSRPAAPRRDSGSPPPALGSRANEPAQSVPTRPARPAFREVSAPVGTALPLVLTTAVSTETATVEMPVTARLRRAVAVDGETVLPAGAVLQGEVTEVERPGRVRGRARLGIRFTSVTVGGQRENLRTNPVTFEGESTKGQDATKIGVGAGIGAVVGGIIGGGDGAAKGAAIGGAAGTGTVLATRGREVQLASGTDVDATLASEFTTTVPVD